MTGGEPQEEPLIFGLRPGEAIVIETSDGTIRVVQLPRWRLSIQAPESVDVLRVELTPPESSD